VRGGEMRGLLDQRDLDLPARMAELNTLAAQIINDVNTLHRTGFGLDGVDGRDFFDGTDASDIRIAAAVDGNPNAIAASSALAGVPGNAEMASLISDMQYARGLLGNTATYDEFWSSFVSAVGTASSEARMLMTSQHAVVDHLEQLRLGAAGVNLDEEMVNLLGHQRAYEAAARLVSIIDQMLDTLINRM
jgi:flagellar hook-associated protein 1